MPISFERGKGGGSIFNAEKGKTATIISRRTSIQALGESDGGFFIIEGGNTVICLNLRRNETGEPTTITDNFTINNRTQQFTIKAS